MARKLGRRPAVVSCFGAGFDGFRLHRPLRRRGIHNLVLDAASIVVSRRSRRPKTDHGLDAEAMVRVLLAYGRGETQVCSVVRVPTPAPEDARRPQRERERLVRERIQHVKPAPAVPGGASPPSFSRRRR